MHAEPGENPGQSRYGGSVNKRADSPTSCIMKKYFSHEDEL